MELVQVIKEEQTVVLAQIADEIWHEHYESILEKEQIDYMICKFQSAKAIKEQLADQGYQYFFMSEGNDKIGYLGIIEEADKKRLFLSKLYIKKEKRGKGYSHQCFDFLIRVCKEKGYVTIWLTVNRFNENSILAYEKMGFHKVREEVSDIGNGYVMDDYIMELDIAEKTV